METIFMNTENSKTFCKTKSKEKEDETNERQEIYIPPGKKQQIIDDLKLF